MEASPQMQKYFDELNKQVKEEYKIAAKARSMNRDPSSEVEISLAKNMAERVLGLISTVAPQIKDSNLVKVIQDLEKQYGILDWRVAFRISEEVAKQNICKFKSEQEAIEVAIRVGFAYVTVGVVSACLEGFTKLEIKKRNDNDQKFFSLFFSGPVRNAGGTAAAVCVLIADYIRRKMGYAQYDPTPEEIKRAVTEVQDYHERVTNLQYYPSRNELEFLLKNMPIEVNGEPTEKIEVSNYKNLPRIKTNLIRGGYALIYSSCIPLKAAKLWKALSKWGKEFDMDQWNFLEEFLKIQKTEKAKVTSGDASSGAGKEKAAKIKPDYTYIADLVAGRPVLGYPLAKGAFRLRYGRSRCSGYSGQCIHPASMYVMNKSIAIGTQAKVERPGKGTVFTSCSTIEGPIVKLDTGEVLMVESVAQARLINPRIKEILFLGDVLVNYGDFFNRAHVLVPPGYCEEWWAQELEKAIVDNFGVLDFEKPAKLMDIDKDLIENLVKKPLTTKVSALDAITISKNLNIPLHPKYTYHWKDITKENFYLLLDWMKKANIVTDVNVSKIILPKFDQGKRILEELGVPHIVATEYVVIEKDDALAFYTQLGNFDLGRFMEIEAEDVLEILNKRNNVKLRDKSGIYIGSRMGRPEKAKMRELKGSPNGLFPIGEQGGKMRSLQSALEKGFVYSGFANFKCTKCDRSTIYRVCEVCGKETTKILHCEICGDIEKPCEHQHKPYSERKIEIMHYFNDALKILGLDKELYPDMIKGVRGTVNQEHIPEHLAKAVLRAKHGVCVNKDGTVRYDCTELPLTHFKPSEIDVSVEKLKQLGYTKDAYGKELENDEQILELKPQDVVIPCCPDVDEPCDKFLLQTAAFIDELLEKFYGQKKYYNCATRQDLVGHLMIGLAPHTSAGSVARIIGFSKNQGLMAHPVFHAALRRDCFDYDSYLPIKQNGCWNVVKIGDLVEQLNPTKVVDNYGTKEVRVDSFSTVGLDGIVKEVKINNFTKHNKQPMHVIATSSGRTIKVTENHKFIVSGKIKLASRLVVGDKLPVPYKINIKSSKIIQLNLLDMLKGEKQLMVRGISSVLSKVNKKKIQQVLKKLNLSNRQFANYKVRDSYPAQFVFLLEVSLQRKIIEIGKIAFKRDNVSTPIIIRLEKDLLETIGLYVAEGYSRTVSGKKGLNQVYIASSELFLRTFVKRAIKRHFGLVPTERKEDRVTFSSKILYLFFTKILKAGSCARDKRIPEIFIGAGKDMLAAVLRGYFEGDGSVSAGEKRVSCDSISEGLLADLEFCLARFGIFVKRYVYEKQPGPQVRAFYERKNREIPKFKITKLIIGSTFVDRFSSIGFLSRRKIENLGAHKKIKARGIKIDFDENFVYDPIISITPVSEKESYCLNVDTKSHTVVCSSILSMQCDGDEAGVFLLLDGLLNFSRKFLPGTRGATMDAPIVLTSIVNPAEVDDMVFDMDVSWKYPLDFYKACNEYKMPWEVKIEQVKERLDKPEQYEGYGFTHDNGDMNDGVRMSSYKTLPTMMDKLESQLDLAEKIRAVDVANVAALVINKHFIKDLKGNLRKFSQQEFRCVNCNKKYRRPPLIGRCVVCNGKIIFTISEGSVIKYLQPSLALAEKYNLPAYLKQTLQLTTARIESVFGKDKEKQEGLGKWFASG